MTQITTDRSQAARLFHALSDETRLQVVEMLSSGERCVCELQDRVGAAQSRLSFHLKVLRDAGLVNDRKQGRWVYYSLRPDVLDDLSALLLDLKPDENAVTWCACGEGPLGSCCG